MAARWPLFFFFLNLNFNFFTIHSSALKLGIYRSSVSASLLVLSIFMCDWKRGDGGHIDFVILFHKSGASNCYQTLSSRYLRKIQVRERGDKSSPQHGPHVMAEAYK